MDIDNLDDLFDEMELLGSSQESLTNATCDPDMASDVESDNEEMLDVLIESSEMRILPGYSVPRAAGNPDSPHVILRTRQPSSIQQIARNIYEAVQAIPTARGKIELIFASISKSLESSSSELVIPLKGRHCRKQPSTEDVCGNVPSQANQADRIRCLLFPAKTATGAWRFTVVVRILEIMHETLCLNQTRSKRDIYYRDPALFGNQGHVDRYVDDIAFTFGLPRSSLNITAVAKGLVAGAVTFNRRDGSTTIVSTEKEGVLIPHLKEVLSARLDNARWLLIIEKEATFHSIIEYSCWPLLAEQGVIITGKGYPDIATRALVHFLATPSVRNNFASPRVYGLSDFDPDGLAIMSTYKHGSASLIHENAGLVCSSLKRIALDTEGIARLCINSDDTHRLQGLVSMTERDRNKARKMLEWERLQQDEEGLRWRYELQVMLMLNVKGELQLLETSQSDTTALLQQHLPVS